MNLLVTGLRRGLYRFNWALTALANHQPESIGGQAVVEGVMMRSPRRLAVAVRAPDGSIVVDNREFLSYSKRFPLLKLPVLRGAVSLVESLAIGIKALNFSVSVQEGGAGTSSNPKAAISGNAPGRKWDNLLAGFGLLVSFALAMAFFQLLPYWTSGQIVGGSKDSPANPFLFNLTAGIVRISLVLAYMWGISHLKDMARLFQYHGAEHKSIFTHEKKAPLTADQAARQSRFHPRCGTSFILIVALVCILFFSVFDALVRQWFGYAYPGALQRFLIHLPFVPLVAGLSFEVLKWTAKYQDSPWVKPLVLPGLWLQRITTREPDGKQLEVAIASIEAALV